MISLGLRFSLKGGREAGFRLTFTALGVAVGVALLLFTLSGFAGPPPSATATASGR
jgi:hypothetical protein